MFKQVSNLNVAFAQKRAQVNAQVWNRAFASDPALDGACGDVEIVGQRRLPARPVEGFASSYQQFEVHRCLVYLMGFNINAFLIDDDDHVFGFRVSADVVDDSRVKKLSKIIAPEFVASVVVELFVSIGVAAREIEQLALKIVALFLVGSADVRAMIFCDEPLLYIVVAKKQSELVEVISCQSNLWHCGLLAVSGRPIAVPIGRILATVGGVVK